MTQRTSTWLDGEVAKGAQGLQPLFSLASGRTVTHLPVFDEAGACVGNMEIFLVESRGERDPNNMRLLRGYLSEMTDAIASRRRRLLPYMRGAALSG